VIDYLTMKIRQDGYQLRPEIVESNYYLWHFTDDPMYRQAARKMFDDYFYLTFADPRTLDFDGVVFNTEAHPLRATWK
jgi:mannosidase alpha-like ER degradation enhancer 2